MRSERPGWSKKQLGDIITLEYGKGLPMRKRQPGSFPVYGSGGIIGFHEKPLVAGPGVIVGRKGSIGTVHYESRDFFPIDTVFYVCLKESGIDLRFLYYMLSGSRLSALNSDAAVPGLNRNVAHREVFSIPSHPIQRKIAAILSAYDDLIENNRRRIEILEETAQLIYREWFVHFRFPGHESVRMVDSPLGPIPEGWEVHNLGDVIELAYGKGLRKSDRVPGPYPVYGSSGVIGRHRKSLVTGPGIVVGRKGNVGSVFWSHDDFYPIDTVFYVVTDVCLHYIFYNLRRQNFINTDAAVPGLKRSQAYLLPFLLPDKQLLERFERITDPVFMHTRDLRMVNATLRRTRDLLLPRLISGQIDVSDLDIDTGELDQ